MPILALALWLWTPLQDARTLDAQIRDVTVFTDSALVHRVAQIPAGGGRFAVEGLPLSADPEQVRVRCVGGDVTDVDVTRMQAPRMADARREELRRRLIELTADLGALDDERRVIDAGVAAANQFLSVTSQESKPAQITGVMDYERWVKTQDSLLARLRELRKSSRELDARRDGLVREKSEVERLLGGADVVGDVTALRVQAAIVASAPSTLEVEYVVSNVGWRPLYDLRTAADARSVELVYRAQVFQQSGEDWNDVDLSLSTAQPQIGAEGPDPMPAWVNLLDSSSRLSAMGYASDKAVPGVLREYESADAPASPAARPFAAVESQGLSVRFHLPSRGTLPSRPEPARVLVGQQSLAVAPEYLCTPALDDHVWLRGKTKNTTEWTILPGEASVYFGADFLGRAQLKAVQPGEEFTLHLGRDPGLSLERVQTEDLAKQPGVFSSRTTQVDGWRVKLQNRGALVARPDGAAVVFVREALPRATDDRIKVELTDAKPSPSEDARWKKDFEEKGFVTWALTVPRGGEALLTWRVKLSFPEGLKIAR